MHTAEIDHGTLEDTNTELAGYGIAITRLGNLDINLDDDDNARLKKLAGDTAYSRLAGGYLAAAQAEMMQGAGQGMAQGGAAVSPVFLGAGLGLGQNMGVPQQTPGYPPPPAPGFAGGQGYAPPAPPAQPAPQQAPPPPAGTVACGNCQSQVPGVSAVRRRMRKACPNGSDRVPVVQGSERARADQLHDLRCPT